jgi:hypothetical protein
MCYEEHEENFCECCGSANMILMESYSEMGITYKEYRCGDCGDESMLESTEEE